MSKGISLHIGLNKVNVAHYNQIRELAGAVNDARYMQHLAKNAFQYGRCDLLLDESATAQKVLALLREYALQLRAGDLLLLTYSGHGSTIQDLYSPVKGDERFDQTWCLYDRQLIDDELYMAFSLFRAGVRIFVISDSCHSGTVTRELAEGDDDIGNLNAEFNAAFTEMVERNGLRMKRLDKKEVDATFSKNQEQYKKVYEALAERQAKQRRPVAAAVKLLAACQDNQVALDGQEHGLFTGQLRTLLEKGKGRSMNIGELHRHLCEMVPYQTPNLFEYGAVIPAFEQYSPFSIAKPAESSVPPAIAKPSERVDTRPVLTPDSDKPTVVSRSHRIALHSTEDKQIALAQIALVAAPKGLMNISIQEGTAILDYEPAPYASPWDIVHEISQKIDENHFAIEAGIAETENYPIQNEEGNVREAGKEADYLPYWPPAQMENAPAAGWHLDEAHSQLATARDYVWAKVKSREIENKLLIGHIDTGYYPEHPAFADHPYIRRDLARSFVRGELKTNLDAEDYFSEGSEVQGHGTGTLGILAGWQINEDAWKNLGYVGAIPFAGIVPIRIAENVVIWDTDAFCDGLEYAINTGCEVVTMSMGGKPSRRMAKLINKAYESGVTIITAAGNNFTKGMNAVGPKTVVYPARFPRVIAACGTSFNQLPYDFEAQKEYAGLAGVKAFDVRYMQGNWGPESCMHHALAAYTPNISWAASTDHESNDQRPSKHLVKKSGGGTSSATPQVAAAAALWITLHHADLKRKGYHRTWRQVEAVRAALYGSAYKDARINWKKYYGNGIIRAMDALKIPAPAAIPEERKAPEAESSWWGISEALDMLLNRDRALEGQAANSRRNALKMEALSVLMASPEGSTLMDNLSVITSPSEAEAQKVAAFLRNAKESSKTLRAVLG